MELNQIMVIHLLLGVLDIVVGAIVTLVWHHITSRMQRIESKMRALIAAMITLSIRNEVNGDVLRGLQDAMKE